MRFDHAHEVLFAAAASLPVEARCRFLTDIARRAPGACSTVLIDRLRRTHMAMTMATMNPGDHVGDSDVFPEATMCGPYDDPDPRGPFVDGKVSPLLTVLRMVPPEHKEQQITMMVDVMLIDGVAPGVVVRVVEAMRRQFGGTHA